MDFVAFVTQTTVCLNPDYFSREKEPLFLQCSEHLLFGKFQQWIYRI